MKEIQTYYKKPQIYPASYEDEKNMLYEYAVFLNSKDGKNCPPSIEIVPPEEEYSHWNNWLKEIRDYFKKEIPDISIWNILGILNNPNYEITYEIMGIASFKLLKEFKKCLSDYNNYNSATLYPITNPIMIPTNHPSSTMMHPIIPINILNPINQKIGTIKKAPHENIINYFNTINYLGV